MKRQDITDALAAWSRKLAKLPKQERKRIFRDQRNMLIIPGNPLVIEPLTELRRELKKLELPNATDKRLEKLGFKKITQSSPEFGEWEKRWEMRVREAGATPSLRNNLSWRPPVFFIEEPRSNINTPPTVAPEDLIQDHIINAMEAFRKGDRPHAFKTPRGWHVVHPRTKEPFPLKGVYGLATGLSCSHKAPDNFKTDDAIRKLKKLDFECVDLRENALDKKLQQGIERSCNDTSEARQERLRSAPHKPVKTMQAVVRFQRNPDVVAQRLHMAQGTCEECSRPAPFHKKKDGTPYLEVHHIIHLADDGDDTVENTLALCPNCHKKAHHG